MSDVLRALLFFCLFNHALPAQTPADSLKRPRAHQSLIRREFAILPGYTYSRGHYLDLCFAQHEYAISGHHPFSWAMYAGSEIRIDAPRLIAPKIGAWLGGGMAIGCNLLYYTDFKEGSLRLRPEMGIALPVFKLMYGVNIPLTNKKMESVGRQAVSFGVIWGLRRKKR